MTQLDNNYFKMYNDFYKLEIDNQAQDPNVVKMLIIELQDFVQQDPKKLLQHIASFTESVANTRNDEQTHQLVLYKTRSGIQFFIDIFKPILEENDDLRALIKDNGIINDLDTTIQSYNNQFYCLSNNQIDDHFFKHNNKEKHWWWFGSDFHNAHHLLKDIKQKLKELALIDSMGQIKCKCDDIFRCFYELSCNGYARSSFVISESTQFKDLVVQNAEKIVYSIGIFIKDVSNTSARGELDKHHIRLIHKGIQYFIGKFQPICFEENDSLNSLMTENGLITKLNDKIKCLQMNANETNIRRTVKETNPFPGKKYQKDESFILAELDKLIFPNGERYDFSIDDMNILSIISQQNNAVKHAVYIPKKENMAVKYLPLPKGKYIGEEELNYVNKLLKEQNNLKKLRGAPNIIHFYGFCLDDYNALLCMELMDCNLRELYRFHHDKMGGTFPEDLVGGVSVCVLDALCYCKSKGIIHRDIKPDNILLNEKGEIKLGDFGGSRTLVKSIALSSVGTFIYWAPERFEDEPYDIRADVWSLGVTLAEIAFGKFPFEKEDGFEEEQSNAFAIAKKFILSIKTEQIEKVVVKCFENNPIACEFLRTCLKRELRPSFEELREKSFYKKYSDKNNFLELAKQLVKDLNNYTNNSS